MSWGLWLGEEAAKWDQSVGWRWMGRRQLHGDGRIAQRGGPLRCWEGRVLGAVERRALAVERRSERDSRESTRQARAPHTTSQRGFFPHEAGQITVGAAWWLCGCAVCNVAARFLDPLLRRWGGPTGQVESIAARCRRPRP